MSEFLLVILLLMLILCMGLPVAFSLGATSVALIFLFGLPLKVVGATMFSSLDSFTTLSIPIFVLMSQILLDGRVGEYVPRASPIAVHPASAIPDKYATPGSPIKSHYLIRFERRNLTFSR